VIYFLDQALPPTVFTTFRQYHQLAPKPLAHGMVTGGALKIQTITGVKQWVSNLVYYNGCGSHSQNMVDQEARV
jgi:hypothetical protein